MLGVALLAGPLTASGVGPATNEDKIAKASSTYLRALADGDTRSACAAAQPPRPGRSCPQALEARQARLNREQLRDAADASIDIDVHGRTATATLGEPTGRTSRWSRPEVILRCRPVGWEPLLYVAYLRVASDGGALAVRIAPAGVPARSCVGLRVSRR